MKRRFARLVSLAALYAAGACSSPTAEPESDTTVDVGVDVRRSEPVIDTG